MIRECFGAAAFGPHLGCCTFVEYNMTWSLCHRDQVITLIQNVLFNWLIYSATLRCPVPRGGGAPKWLPLHFVGAAAAATVSSEEGDIRPLSPRKSPRSCNVATQITACDLASADWRSPMSDCVGYGGGCHHWSSEAQSCPPPPRSSPTVLPGLKIPYHWPALLEHWPVSRLVLMPSASWCWPRTSIACLLSIANVLYGMFRSLLTGSLLMLSALGPLGFGP